MGNVPGKEERRNRASSNASNSAFSESFRNSYRRNPSAGLPSSLSNLKKSKRQKEKDLQREEHYSNLVVKLNENVDGGFLAPYGTYKSNLDYNTEIVRQLIINRKLSPFYTPLQDFNDDWSDNELCIILGQLPLHAIDDAYPDIEEEDDVDDHKIHKSANFLKKQEQKQKLKTLVAKVKQTQKNEEQIYQDLKQMIKENISISSDRKEEMSNIPSQDFLLYLYKNAIECPICFLYYPNYLNVSRCCLQPICTECFVQIKRLDPHPPHDDNSNSNSNEDTEKENVLNASLEKLPETLISEPANCPFCAMPDFGVTYLAPNFRTGFGGIEPSKFRSNRRGITSTIHEETDVTKIKKGLIDDISNANINGASNSAISNSPLNSDEFLIDNSNVEPLRRKSSVAANAPGVVTIDQIRPDWESQLMGARTRLARKAAAATAIHASNLLISGNEPSASNSRRRFGHRRASSTNSIEERMIEEALKLSLMEEEERKIREKEQEKEKERKKN